LMDTPRRKSPALVRNVKEPRLAAKQEKPYEKLS